eukprot:130832_1
MRFTGINIIWLLLCNHLLTATDLSNNRITINYVFSASNSPYYVYNILHFTESSNVLIENDVEIILMENNIYIQFDGDINCGCNNSTNNTTTSSYIQIHNNYKLDSMDGFIKINNTFNMNANIKFCNTKFDSLYYGIYIVNPLFTNITINNCTFSNIENSVLYSGNEAIENISKSTGMTYIANSIIRNVSHVQTNQFGQIIYDNMNMEHQYGFCGVTTRHWHWQDSTCYDFITIRNSNLFTNNRKYLNCLTLSSYAMIYNNQINNCHIGISTRHGVDIHISNNTFKNIHGEHVISTDTLNGVIVNNLFINNNITKSIITHWVAWQLQAVKSALILENNQFAYNYVGRSFVYLSDYFLSNMSLDAHIKNNMFLHNQLSGDFIYIAGKSYNIDIDANIFECNQYFDTTNPVRVIYANVNKFYLNYNVFKNNTFESEQWGIGDTRFLIVAINVTWNYNTFHNKTTLIYSTNMDTKRGIKNLIMQYNSYFGGLLLFVNGMIHNQSNFKINYNNVYNFNQTDLFIQNWCPSDINAKYNYYDGIIDMNKISSQIDDYCSNTNDNPSNGIVHFIPFFAKPIINFDNITYINNTHTTRDCLYDSTKLPYPMTTEYNTTDIKKTKQITTTQQLTTEYGEIITTENAAITTENGENRAGFLINFCVIFVMLWVI